MQHPPFLQEGDFIGIVATGRAVDAAQLNRAISFFINCGWRVKTGFTIGRKHFQLGGTEEERLQDINLMIRDPEVRAIFIARGGFGHLEIVDHIDWQSFQKDPKWICGFSDVTVLHNHILQNLGFQTLHCSLPYQWEDQSNDPLNCSSIYHRLKKEEDSTMANSLSIGKKGSGEGVLIGGNLSILHCLMGSHSEPDFAGKILLIEEVDEYLYHVDRMLQTLKRAGKLKQLSGMLVGQFKDMNDHQEPFGANYREIILKHSQSYDFPILFDLPIGHGSKNYGIKLGKKVTINTAEDQPLLNF